MIAKPFFSISFLLTILLLAPVTLLAVQPQFVIIGTAGPTGVYYPAGNAICRAINKQRKKERRHSIHCNAIQSDGSLGNIARLATGEIDLAIVQADVLNDAYQGNHGLAANTELRTLLSLYDESLSIIVRKDSGIKRLEQLVGKRISLGAQGSGQRYTMRKLFQTKSWKLADFVLVDQFNQQQLASALCTNQIDAFAFMAGHPSGLLKQVSNECDIKILNIDEALIQQLLSQNPVYKSALIPAKTYRGNGNVSTISVPALLVSNQSFSGEQAHHIVDNIMKSMQEIKRMHPALENFDLELSNVLAPIHDASSDFSKQIKK